MKLNASHRTSIIAKALTHAFQKREKAHEKLRVKFADELYTHHFGAAEKIAAKLPEDWQRFSSGIYVQHPDFNHRNEIDPSKASGTFTTSKRRLCADRTPWQKLTPEHPFYDRAHDLALVEIKMNRERIALRQKLEAIVYSANTIKQLAETWPEGKKFFPSEQSFEPRGMIPASVVSDVNAALGIGK